MDGQFRRGMEFRYSMIVEEMGFEAGPTVWGALWPNE